MMAFGALRWPYETIKNWLYDGTIVERNFVLGQPMRSPRALAHSRLGPSDPPGPPRAADPSP
jgi:hypothetical protein